MIFIQDYLKERIVFLVGPVNDAVASLSDSTIIIFRVRKS